MLLLPTLVGFAVPGFHIILESFVGGFEDQFSRTKERPQKQNVEN